MGRCVQIACLALFLSAGCATTNPEMEQRMDQWEGEMREELEALKRAVEASYDRERALSERLYQSEEDNAVLQQKVEMLRAKFNGMRQEMAVGAAHESPSVFRSAEFDIVDTYQTAREQYGEHRYSEALDLFAEVVQTAPDNQWADNAQYWMGECYYGMGKYQQALTEFTKVFAFRKTEKADDAQLKIARCYQALGQKEKALAAFQKVLDDFPKSEYAPVVRREMKYLSGP